MVARDVVSREGEERGRKPLSPANTDSVRLCARRLRGNPRSYLLVPKKDISSRNRESAPSISPFMFHISCDPSPVKSFAALFVHRLYRHYLDLKISTRSLTGVSIRSS